MRRYPRIGGLEVDQAAAEAQPNWLAYSSADVLVFDLAELEWLAEDADAFVAVRRWVAAGGTLWIENTPGVAGLSEVAERLDGDGMLFGVGSELGDQAVSGAPDWRYESLAPPIDKSETVAENQTDGVEIRLGDVAAMIVGKDSRGWYAVREFGFGRVVAFPRIASVVPRGLSDQERERGVQRWNSRGWASRHGVAAAMPSTRFGNLLIPGVGVAPVGEFQVLITLFVMLIGPVNYWLLRRAQRLHLLVLTAPIGAAAVTVGLIVYALVNDGFGVKARVRSLTLINQTSDGAAEAASWSRVTRTTRGPRRASRSRSTTRRPSTRSGPRGSRRLPAASRLRGRSSGPRASRRLSGAGCRPAPRRSTW